MGFSAIFQASRWGGVNLNSLGMLKVCPNMELGGGFYIWVVNSIYKNFEETKPLSSSPLSLAAALSSAGHPSCAAVSAGTPPFSATHRTHMPPALWRSGQSPEEQTQNPPMRQWKYWGCVTQMPDCRFNTIGMFNISSKSMHSYSLVCCRNQLYRDAPGFLAGCV